MAKNKTINARVQHKHDTEVNWNKATGFYPLKGELIIYDPDENYPNYRFKIGNGDGKTLVKDLPFATNIGNGKAIKADGKTDNKSIQQILDSDTKTWNLENNPNAEIILNSDYGDKIHQITAGNLKAGALGQSSACFNSKSQAAGKRSATFGSGTVALGECAFAEGMDSVALGNEAHVEGIGTTATGNHSHAEGTQTISAGQGSHSEGVLTVAKDTGSHAEGYNNTAEGKYSHAEGHHTQALKEASHSEGKDTEAHGLYSHTQGNVTKAYGVGSTAMGDHTVAKGNYTLVRGKYNIEDKTPPEENYNHGSFVDIVGNGVLIRDKDGNPIREERSNAYMLGWDGTGFYAGDIYTQIEIDPETGMPYMNEENKVATLSDLDEFITETELNDKLDNINITLDTSNIPTKTEVSNAVKGKTEKGKYAILTDISPIEHDMTITSTVKTGLFLKSCGQNIWDEKVAESFSDIDASNADRLKNLNAIDVSENIDYYFYCLNLETNAILFDYIKFLNSTKSNLKTYTDVCNNTTITAPSNACYMEFLLSESYATTGNLTYKNDICINISDERINGTYAPYQGSDSSSVSNYSCQLKSFYPITTIMKKINVLYKTATFECEYNKDINTVIDNIGNTGSGDGTSVDINLNLENGSGTNSLQQKTDESGQSWDLLDGYNQYVQNNTTWIYGAEGKNSTALGETTAHGQHALSSGYNSLAFSSCTFATGNHTIAGGMGSTAMGLNSVAVSRSLAGCCHAEGKNTKALGDYSHSEGNSTTANLDNSHVEGLNSSTIEKLYCFIPTAQNGKTITCADDDFTDLEDGATYVIYTGYDYGILSEPLFYYGKIRNIDKVNKTFDLEHTMNYNDESWFGMSMSEKRKITNQCIIINGGIKGSQEVDLEDFLVSSHAEGIGTVAGLNGHAEGNYTLAQGIGSHAEGHNTQTLGYYSHAEGEGTISHGFAAHAEGRRSYAYAHSSHAEGQDNIVDPFAIAAHAEGIETIVEGLASHTEGYHTRTHADYAHAEGELCRAEARGSHAEGIGSVSKSEGQHVAGKWNLEDQSKAVIVGNGTGEDIKDNDGKWIKNRKNIYTLDWEGNAWFKGNIIFNNNKNLQSILNKTVKTDDFFFLSFNEIPYSTGIYTVETNATNGPLTHYEACMVVVAKIGTGYMMLAIDSIRNNIYRRYTSKADWSVASDWQQIGGGTVQVLSSDPSEPADGQMWLRSDI